MILYIFGTLLFMICVGIFGIHFLLSSIIENGVLKMKDVDRATVYSKHLGEKLL